MLELTWVRFPRRTQNQSINIIIMRRVTKEQAKKAFEILRQYVEDKNVGCGAHEHMLLNMSIGCVFCEDNREELSEDIIELMAIQSLSKHFDSPIYIGVEPVVNRFKRTVLKYLIKQTNSDERPHWLVIGSRGVCNRCFAVRYTEDGAKECAKLIGKDYPYVQIIYSTDDLGMFE